MNNHIPVLLPEVLKYLKVNTGEKYIDATLGGGGYTEAILQNGGEVLGIDCDPKAIERTEKRLQSCPDRYYTVPVSKVFHSFHGNFSNLKNIASENDFAQIDGIVFDLGFASFQMDNPSYGLSIFSDGPLDMRLDPNLGVTAADLLNTLSEKQLVELFANIGQESYARPIAREICKYRQIVPFVKTSQLRELIENMQPKDKVLKIHPATKIYMALRIAVNSEIENLRLVLPQALELLKKEGRLVVVSFHSGEDSIVKNFFRDSAKDGFVKILTPKPIGPGFTEIEQNPRSRSARMRVIEKL